MSLRQLRLLSPLVRNPSPSAPARNDKPRGTASFNASGGNNGYVWGGSASGSGATQNIVFNSPGTYTVTTYSPGGGNYTQSNTASASVTVNTVGQTVSISPPSQSIIAGGSVTFTASGGNNPDERPFVLTRAAFAGAQRWAASWTGDNSGTWNHLAMSTPMLLSLGLSGYGIVGDDIGGFAGSAPPDLLTRWLELGAFNPIFRGHANKGTRDREPWVDGPEHEAMRRRAIEARYALLPYLYTSVEEMTRTGEPLICLAAALGEQAAEAVGDRARSSAVVEDIGPPLCYFRVS